MNQNQPESPQTEINPWESTVVGETYVDTGPNPLQPSAMLLWTCIVCSMVVKGFLIWKSIASDPFFMVKLLSYGLPELAMAALMGLGIAMLVHVIFRQRFAQMMPGHWRLIVFGLTLSLETGVGIINSVAGGSWDLSTAISIQAITLGVLTMVFYAAVLWTTSEGPRWRTYAVLSVLASAFMISRIVTRLMATAADQAYVHETIAGLGIATLLLHFALLVVLVVGVILDWQRKIPRDINHYLGVYLVSIVPFLAGFIDRFVERLMIYNSM
ncbi:hypothetical protein C5Y96_05075 [Blastopirellula marina]|uniref:Uncharacterized protein n=1 Tax=Blastopirellula marina TaxID=124 RepID=A0A2S8G450_9BACT|nr:MULTISPECIES: hypothetical protein [Pirellulaceae]PQO39232.1 hypothetical protein C5Y96_05075 [Blastopirellula marina]RCS55540.1 hypothetical protein DTL36_05085 [Bremerella cremea]